MTRPRIALGLEASRPDLDAEVCAQVGRQLAAARLARGLTVKQVAASLLLGPVQVTALEDVHPEVFYGADFYVNALRKYATLVGLDLALVNRALIRRNTTAGAVAPVTPVRRSVERSVAAIPGPGKRIIVAAAVVVTGVAGWLLVAAVSHRTPLPAGMAMARTQVTTSSDAMSPAPAVEDPASTLPEANVTTAPAADTATEPAKVDRQEPSAPAALREATSVDETVGHISVARRTWIFVRYGDNSTVQRGLAPGERFVLQDVPTYLAVGSAADTAVVIGGRTIDNAPFTTNGQLRVGSSQLARLSTQRQ